MASSGEAPEAAATAGPSPELKASTVSRLFWHWLHSLVVLGNKRPLQEADLYDMNPKESTEYAAQVWQSAVEKREKAAREGLTLSSSRPGSKGSHCCGNTSSGSDSDVNLRRKSKATSTIAARLPSIWYAVFTTAGREFFLAALWKPMWLAAVMLQVYVLKVLVQATEDHGEGLRWWWGTLLVLAMPLTSVVQSVSMHMVMTLGQKAGMKVRAAVALTVFDKALAARAVAVATVAAEGGAASSSSSTSGTGQLLNLVTNDTQKLVDAATYFHHVWFALVELLVLAAFCVWEVGAAAVPGVMLAFCTQPLLVCMARAVGRLRRKAVAVTDARVRLVGDLLTGVRVVKYNGWTSAFLAQVEELRSKELRWITKAAYLRAATSTVRDATTPLASLATFGTYVALHDGNLDSSKAFVVLALFSLLVRVFAVAPVGLLYAMEAFVAVQRLQKVVDMPDGDADPRAGGANDVPDPWPASNGGDGGKSRLEDVPVHVEKGTMFSWSFDDKLSTPEARLAARGAKRCSSSSFHKRSTSLRVEDEQTLEHESKEQRLLRQTSNVPDISINAGFICIDDDFTVSRGDLVAIVGLVGSGKSSLLLALLGEMHKVRGSFHTDDVIAYVPQVPWIFNASVRDNILFRNPYDKDRYRKVISACAMEQDISQFDAGDETEIGERGINLSGGQRARIGLARACYSSAQLLFLDDPLAAVDVPTARHLMLHALGGLLKGRTVILVTHNKSALRFCDRVHLMNNGRLQKLDKDDDVSQHMVAGEEDIPGREAVIPEHKGSPPEEILSTGHEETGMLVEPEGQQSLVNEAQVSTPENVLDRGIMERSKSGVATTKAGGLTVKEDRVEGVVTLSNYVAYLKGAGLGSCALVVLAFVTAQVIRVMVDYWLGVWVDGKYHLKPSQYVSIYAAFAVGANLLSVARVLLFARAAMKAAKTLHEHMAEKVFRSPQTFFDQNPSGRILNRFSKDQSLVDELLPVSAQFTLEYMTACFGTLILVAVIIPWFLVAVPPFLAGFVLLQRLYIAISRELKRLDGTSRSPMYEHFAQTVAGATSIRAYGVQAAAHDRFVTLIDANHRAFILFVHAGRWLAIRLDCLAAMCVTASALLVVVLRRELGAGLAGVVLVQSLQLTGFFQFAVRMAGDTENYFTSVERIQAYATLPTEADPRTPPGVVTPDWPSSGAIEFQDYTMAYREDLPPALNNLSFKLEPQTKLGIVGRTGAGKSSLAAAIFRMVENRACHGRILVDGVDIGRVGLDDLRQRISIIPQDPVLFRGSVRMNLDPFQQHSDHDMNAALARVHLKDKVQTLDSMVESNGENFSVGQRQLLCLARALLRKSRIIVMDEATAAVDAETDKLIQRTMKEVFRDCTVITIAHRIETVIDSDLLLVLAAAGRIAELDSPANLLRRTHASTDGGESQSIFSEMVAQSGREIALQLRQAAEAAEAIRTASQTAPSPSTGC